MKNLVYSTDIALANQVESPFYKGMMVAFSDYKTKLQPGYFGIEMLSDLDYMLNSDTDKFDIPAIEWCGQNGKHWESFKSEEDRDVALLEYSKNLELYKESCDIVNAYDKHEHKLMDLNFYGSDLIDMSHELIESRKYEFALNSALALLN